MNRISQIAAVAAVVCAVTGAARPGLAQTCEGDCNNDGQVMVDELVGGVRIALGRDDPAACASLDLDGDGSVLVHELIAAVLRGLEGCPYPRDGALRLNQIQVLGSHNSYHIRPAQPILDALRAFTPQLSEPLEYDHPALGEQFDDQRIRQIELDVFADPFGGLYSTPYGLELTTGDPNARIPELGAAGFKVLHIQDIDFQTVCQTFIECLEDVKAWSDAHPLHMPIMILVEAKDDVLPDLGFNFVTPLPIGEEELDGLDAEMRSVFPPERLITPDDVRGTHATLADAVRTDGWPTLGASRGKVLFCLDNGNPKRADYIRNHPSLQGRVMFTSSPANAPEAAFMKLNDPIGDFDEIQTAVAEGFVVRTRSDADTVEARTNDTTPRDMALASGAQWVSTDYPVPDPVFGTGYMVEIPTGMPARCNPISAPAECASLDIENPAHLGRAE